MLTAPTRADAGRAFDRFLAVYRPKYPKAADCLPKDRAALLAFYDFPAEHWPHLRTTNPIESTFATVRLRTDKTRGCVSRDSLLALVFMLVKSAERHWRKLNGIPHLADVIAGISFKDGAREDVEKIAAGSYPIHNICVYLHGTPEIFKTDQGSQFTSEAFTRVLKGQQIRISLDGKGRALDNILVERLGRSVKYEEVYLPVLQHRTSAPVARQSDAGRRLHGHPTAPERSVMSRF